MLFESIRNLVEGKPGGKIECNLLKKDCKEFPADFSASIINDADGKPQFVMGITRDLTEQKKLEAQFLQAQKMESIGRLAGGVAHDFNNLLTAIIGHSELMEQVLKPDDPLIKDINVIQQASDQASDLTRQLLAFSRKQTLQPKIVDLHQVITSMSKMLQRIIGEDIKFTVNPATDLWGVEVDPGQMEQVIVNLAVNARDAMPAGGKLAIKTQNIELKEKIPLDAIDIPPAKYVVLSISDTGSGIAEEIKTNIFEPFFTTKELGKGTGLGLSTVYGIVRQSNGYILVQSEAGVGTTFMIYLPAVKGEIETTKAIIGLDGIPVGRERVLIVEDDEIVRRVTVEALKRYGYEVIEARTGRDALLQCAQMNKPVDLVITDVVMPNLNGPEFIAKLEKIWPEFKKLYISGYSEHSILNQRALRPHLQKPFRPQKLAIKVREVLDGMELKSRNSTDAYS